MKTTSTSGNETSDSSVSRYTIPLIFFLATNIGLFAQQCPTPLPVSGGGTLPLNGNVRIYIGDNDNKPQIRTHYYLELNGTVNESDPKWKNSGNMPDYFYWEVSQPGDYSVVATNENCSSYSPMSGTTSVYPYVPPQPPARLTISSGSGNPERLCPGSSFTLTASGPDDNAYKWTAIPDVFDYGLNNYPRGKVLNDISLSATYYVERAATPATKSDGFSVTVLSPITSNDFSISPNSTGHCAGSGSVLLTATTVNQDLLYFTWEIINTSVGTIPSTGNNNRGTEATLTWNPNYNTGTTTSIQVTAHGSCGTNPTKSIQAQVTKKQTFLVEGGGATCLGIGSPISISAESGEELESMSYRVYKNGVAQSPVRIPNDNGNNNTKLTWTEFSDVASYTVSGSNTGCFTIEGNPVSITRKSPGTINLGWTPSNISPPLICGNDPVTVTLNASNGVSGNYQWKKNGAVVTNSSGGPYGLASLQAEKILDSPITYEVAGRETICSTMVNALVQVPVLFKSLPNAEITPPHTSDPVVVCHNCTKTLTTANAPPGKIYSYIWFLNQNVISGSSNTIVASDQGTYKVKINETGGCENTTTVPFTLSKNNLASVAITGAANVTLPQTSINLGSSVTDPDGPIQSVSWIVQTTNDPPVTSALTQPNLSISQMRTGRYSVTLNVTDNFGEASSSMVTIDVVTPPNNYNYIRESVILKEGVTAASEVSSLSATQKNVNITYIDGLGRTMQSVSKASSPGLQDVVIPVIYDQFGREPIKYLPYVSGTSGEYKSNPVGTSSYTGSPHYAFYSNLAHRVANDVAPYSQTQFEPSPLNRPVNSYGPGSDWYNNNKSIKMDYQINIHGTAAGQEKIIVWSVDTNGLISRAAAEAGYIETGGYYSSGQLSIKSTTDEMNNVVREYTDKQGHVILKKVQSGGTVAAPEFASTYYIYDNLGNLAVVVPPEGVEKMIAITGN